MAIDHEISDRQERQFELYTGFMTPEDARKAAGIPEEVTATEQDEQALIFSLEAPTGSRPGNQEIDIDPDSKWAGLRDIREVIAREISPAGAGRLAALAVAEVIQQEADKKRLGSDVHAAARMRAREERRNRTIAKRSA